MTRLYKAQQLPPEGPILILDNQTFLEPGGSSILESLESRIKRTQIKLLWLQKEIEQAKEQREILTKQALNANKETRLKATKILQEVEAKAKEIKEETKETREKGHEQGYKQGYEEGLKKGIEEGKTVGTKEAKAEVEKILAEAKQEAESLVAKTNEQASIEINKIQEQGKKLLIEAENVLFEANDKRRQIIEETKSMMLSLGLLIAKKVVKVECEKNKEVILKNLEEALKKVKGQERVTVKVNFSDLESLKLHEKKFLSSMPKLEGIRFEEDETIEAGGCKVETNFGFIDAQISTQLEAIEEKLKDGDQELDGEHP